MKLRYSIFIDESGSSSPKQWSVSPYFTTCGLVIREDSRDKLRKEFDSLKQKHFGKKNYIIHSVDLHKHLKTAAKISRFTADLEELLKNNHFFLLYVVVDQEKAFKRSWVNTTIYNRSYKLIVSNLIKFLIAKNSSGRICAEASAVSQDIHLYESFFHFISSGISRLNIKPKDVKEHLTEVSYVTKINNDPEEQLADLFAVCGKLKVEVDLGKRSLESLTPITQLLLKQMEKRLFNNTTAQKKEKVKIYKEMNPFILLP